MWRDNFINVNPATIMQRLYQIKAEQDGRDVIVIAHAVRRDEQPTASTGAASPAEEYTAAASLGLRKLSSTPW